MNNEASHGSPSISLLIPSYNRPEMIREAVLSLVANGRPGVEIIVADDKSPRQSEVHGAIADLVASGTVLFIGHQQNLGWSNNRNSLVRAAKGDWVMLLGDDDRLKPGALDRIFSWMRRYPGAAAYGFGYDVIDEEGTYVCRRKSTRRIGYELSADTSWQELFYFDALPMWSHHPFTMCIQREVALAHPYNSEMGIADDVLFLFGLLITGHRFDVIPESLFEWRRAIQLDRQYRGLSGDPRRTKDGQLRVLRHLLQIPGKPASVERLVTSELFIRRFLKTNAGTARRIATLVRQGRTFDISADQLPADSTSGLRGWVAQLRRHLRIAGVLGPRHWQQAVQCAWDRQHHRYNCIPNPPTSTQAS
jgi:glycosyltransferase involved in cell wall biosynthesis